jgi:5-hydroxyisourate hydrolase
VSQSRPTISTHVLDTGAGRPAPGIRVRLWRLGNPGSPGWDGTADIPGATDDAALAGPAGEGVTDDDGRIRDLLAGAPLEPGAYRIAFEIDRGGFFTGMALDLRIEDVTRSYHVPLLLAPFGLSTYRGS